MTKKHRDKDYEVGYGRPPKHSQFKKGQSGNPSGRPKEPTTFLDSFNKALSKDVKVIKDGKEHRITSLSALAQKYLNLILSGDYRFIKLFMDKNAKEVDIGPYVYPQEESEIFSEGPSTPPTKPQSEAVLEVKAWLREAIKERLANGETIYDDKPKE